AGRGEQGPQAKPRPALRAGAERLPSGPGPRERRGEEGPGPARLRRPQTPGARHPSPGNGPTLRPDGNLGKSQPPGLLPSHAQRLEKSHRSPGQPGRPAAPSAHAGYSPPGTACRTPRPRPQERGASLDGERPRKNAAVALSGSSTQNILSDTDAAQGGLPLPPSSS